MSAPTIELRQGSLTEGTETVWVNASNTNGTLGSGVSAAVRKGGGPGLQQIILDGLQASFGGPMEPGQVLVTNAGASRTAKFIAHVAVMDYRDGFGANSFPTPALIKTCCERLWPALEALPGTERHSIAMVALGAGTGNLGVVDPTRIALETLAAHLRTTTASRIERVRFYGYHLHEYLAMAEVMVTHDQSLLGAMPEDVQRHLKQKG